jgi:probable HAF family extracellular repeat protein
MTFLNDINDSGIAVGSSSIPDGRKRAVIWRNNRLRDLNKLIARDTGWLLIDATSINNQRQIVGGGLFAGEYHAFLLNPLERSTAR